MKQSFRAINGLRFVAAVAVVCFHYGTRVHGFQQLPLVLRRWAECGPIALGFFFILSGFLLAYVNSAESMRWPYAYRNFWLARLARLYPAYLLAYVLFLPIAAVKYLLHPVGLTHMQGAFTFAGSGTLSLLLLQAWTPLSQAWNGPSWSLSVEAFFYFLFPFLALRLARLSTWAAACRITLLWLPLPLLALARTQGRLSVHLWESLLRNNPIVWTPLFVGGMLLARAVPIWQRLKPGIPEAIGIGSVLTLLLTCAAVPTAYQETLISGGLAPLLIIIVLAFSHQHTWTSRLLGSNTFDALGRVSYLIYILQAPIWHFYLVGVNRLFPVPLPGNEVFFWQFAAFLPVLVGCAFLIRRTVEVPGHRWLKRILISANHKATQVQAQQLHVAQ